MQYNTQQKRMPLPEYGRSIQNMVDHALTIEDRAERQRCANTIINIMGNMFPHLRDVPDFKHKLWDHLAIMANFQLDIDYPYEIIRKDNLNTKPESIPYPSTKIRYRHYGRTLEVLIKKAIEFPEGEENINGVLVRRFKADPIHKEKIYSYMRGAKRARKLRKFLYQSHLLALVSLFCPIWTFRRKYEINALNSNVFYSSSLFSFIKEHKKEYKAFIPISLDYPQMYYTALYAPEKTIVIPTMHYHSVSFRSIPVSYTHLTLPTKLEV